jgi:hypothetical protein
MAPHSLMYVQTDRAGLLERRTFLRRLAWGAGAVGVLGWKDLVIGQADELRKQGLACILLWMGGGPSQFETFDPKPGTSTGGPTRAIPTAVPGIQIAAGWERLAAEMADVAVIRSMTHKEGEHERASYQLHTGYTPTPAVKHPTLGSLVVSEMAPRETELPQFVRIGSYSAGIGPGLLGPGLAPFNVPTPLAMPKNITLPGGVDSSRLNRRLELVQDLSEDFAEQGGTALVRERQQLLRRAGRMILSKDLEALDVAKEKDAVRERYGKNPFGQGCLMARRLIERGVTFVEVVSGHPEAPAAWDTHIDNFNVTAKLMSWTDPAFAALLTDLKERGLLGKTLIIWMGEFGRTPKINDRGPSGGRDHYPNAFSVALAGCGIKGGQVVGATDKQGVEVVERPVSVADLFCTFCRALNINPRKRNLAPGAVPVKIVDGGTAVQELF